ncbi:MAG: 2Fe-2S iron-sulfur cluster-binding protein [Aquabacterium sp.]
MLSLVSRLFASQGPVTAHINGRPVALAPKETLLQAALREGIAFPHSCRVGGCATCKCKLVSGKVRELTQSGYILSDDELDQGYILACQAVPQTDVRIEVDLSAQPARRQVGGRILVQEHLTHDIVQLRVQLDEALAYKAGQFADLTLEGLPGVARSYSFATPVQPDAQVSFFVRLVPGGQFSTRVHSHELAGQRITVQGPAGDFWLRPGTAPLLLLAGGSGLAPILAMLTDARSQGVNRPVTLLFGARQQRDLYAMQAIEALARDWPADFRFLPVLSDEPPHSTWAGARGLVTDVMDNLVAPNAHAYLCGPPPMVDAARALLQRHGLAAADIHADRFTTLHDKPLAA